MAEGAVLKKERWVLIALFFISGLLTATWSSRIPAIQNKLDLSNASLGTVLFAIPAGLIVGLSVASWLVATFGTKRILLISAVFSAFFLVLAATATSTIHLMAILFLIGLGRTIYNLAANTGAIELQRQFKQPIISTFHGVWSMACFIAAGIGTLLIILDIAPLYHFFGIAIIVAVSAVALIGTKSNAIAAGERKPFFVKPDKYLFMLGILGLCATLAEGAMFDWSVNYFDKVVKADKSFVTTGYLAFIITMALGRLTGDRIIAAFGMYRMLVINGLLMAAGFAMAALFPFVVPATIGFFLVGIGDSILVPIIFMLAAKSTKMSATYALSSVTLIAYTGFLIGPLFIGNISDWLGMPFAFLALSGVSIIMLLVSLQVKKLSP